MRWLIGPWAGRRACCVVSIQLFFVDGLVCGLVDLYSPCQLQSTVFTNKAAENPTTTCSDCGSRHNTRSFHHVSPPPTSLRICSDAWQSARPAQARGGREQRPPRQRPRLQCRRTGTEGSRWRRGRMQRTQTVGVGKVSRKMCRNGMSVDQKSTQHTHTQRQTIAQVHALLHCCEHLFGRVSIPHHPGVHHHGPAWRCGPVIRIWCGSMFDCVLV